MKKHEIKAAMISTAAGLTFMLVIYENCEERAFEVLPNKLKRVKIWDWMRKGKVITV
jgi:hypothetical protein